MIEVVDLYHIGVCHPLHICELISRNPHSKTIFLPISVFTKEQLDSIKGVIDVTHGIVVFYLGISVTDIEEVKDVTLKYVMENRHQIAEEWNNWQLKRDIKPI